MAGCVRSVEVGRVRGRYGAKERERLDDESIIANRPVKTGWR